MVGTLQAWFENGALREPHFLCLARNGSDMLNYNLLLLNPRLGYTFRLVYAKLAEVDF